MRLVVFVYFQILIRKKESNSPPKMVKNSIETSIDYQKFHGLMHPKKHPFFLLDKLTNHDFLDSFSKPHFRQNPEPDSEKESRLENEPDSGSDS